MLAKVLLQATQKTHRDPTPSVFAISAPLRRAVAAHDMSPAEYESWHLDACFHELHLPLAVLQLLQSQSIVLFASVGRLDEVVSSMLAGDLGL